MKVLILSGGTGSKQLQQGLYQIFSDKIDINLLINCYDNGGTTGVVRQVLDGNILGPSDLKKNQFWRHELKYGNTDILKFLKERITTDNPEEEITKIMDNYKLSNDAKNLFLKSIEYFFSKPLSKVIDYEDFSISSLIYAGLAGLYNNSITNVGTEMSKILNIEDFVIINDNESLYLNAISIDNKIIDDEGDIVKWNNSQDIIKQVWLENVNGIKKLPTLNQKSIDAILDADIIIFSSGTQWSSLIPTYMSNGFKETIEKSKAKKYLIINCEEDKDMTGVGVKELVPILERFLPLEQTTTIFSNNAQQSMKYYSDFKYSYIIGDNISKHNSKIHNPYELITLIFKDYYKDYLNNECYYVFDWDDTIRSRKLSMNETTKYNIKYLQYLNEFSIITGNDISTIDQEIQNKENVMIFADGGNNFYLNNKFIKYLSDDVYIKSPEKIINMLYDIGINRSKIHNRNNCTISIKPLDPEYRKPLELLINKNLSEEDNLIARSTGKTTIDITKIKLDKNLALNYIKDNIEKDIIYIGDEYYKNGNDYCIFSRNDIKFLKVNSVKDTSVFLTIYYYYKNGF